MRVDEKIELELALPRNACRTAERRVRMRLLSLTALVLLCLSPLGVEQETTWQRNAESTAPEAKLFHSTHAINLETAHTISQTNIEFQIYNRFVPPISEGFDFFYGLDGPANIRLGLAYGITDDLTVGLARSSNFGNVDLRARYVPLKTRTDIAPVAVAVQGGMAWNTNVFGRIDGHHKNYQFYGQAIFNTLIEEKLGIGVVPSFLYNGDFLSEENYNSVALSVYAQYYFLRRFSVLAEWTGVVDGFERDYDCVSIGVEIQTAGHFFKILVTNSLTQNPSHYLAGANQPFTWDDIRLGFNTTRLLDLW